MWKLFNNTLRLPRLWVRVVNYGYNTVGKGRQLAYISLGNYCSPLAGRMMASDNLLNFKPLSEISERGFSFHGLLADVRGAAWEDRGQ